jgi:5'-deoxynucleotidase YfbR-like HD superfamily hydrolase
MTVPGRVEAASLLRSLDPPAWLLRHSRAVAEVATFLATRAADRGVPVDRRLAETAALLHDVDKVLPSSHPRRALPHGLGSAAWLEDAGVPELAGAVAMHPVTRLRDAAWLEDWLETSRPEDRIVAYADKRAGQRLESLDARFASWDRRYPDAWDAGTRRAVREAAERLETDVCALAGVAPEAVRRMWWTAAAFEAAGQAAA